MTNNYDESKSQSKAELPRARARYIAQSIQLEESDAPYVVSVGIAATVVLVVAFVIWTYITPVNEVAISEGKIVPHGNNHIVQHFEGGIVEDILVREGELVSKGEILLEVSPIAIESDYDQLKSRSSSMILKQIRLRALLSNVEPEFDQYADQYPELAAIEYETYQAQVRSQQAKLQTLQTKINQRNQELKRDTARTKALKQQLEVVQEQVKIRSALVKKGVVAKTDLLDRQAELAEIRTDYIQSNANVAVAKEAINEAQDSLSEIENKFIEQIKLETGSVAAEIAELKEQLIKFGDRVDRLHIRAPVSGYVTNLAVNSIRAVIEPSQILLEVVPVDKELIVESRVSTQDIGHVHVGQEAVIKVGSYDPQRFGVIEGEVDRISPSTYLDEENQPYYKAQIILAKKYLGPKPGKYKLIPGMTVTADIRTGEKTVLDYLLKPVYRGFQNAFQER
ncbi:MAG: HlyD family type I secretion periplasmic adaptor subunit [Gammaproteobacteria bacterium]|nr:HlyD family type I secretion periplasmic adaptor subunit [Gammaproteobacteria bacterium]